MKEILEFLEFLENVKLLRMARLQIYSDGSGSVYYDDEPEFKIELFSFNSLEELLEKTKYYEQI